MKLSRYTVFHSDGSKIYLYHQLSRELLCIDQELADVLKSDDFSTLPTELANYLHSVHILVDNDLEESDIIRTANIRSRFQSKILRVTIMPTLNCNFHCWYCYEQHFESVLSSENVTALLTFIKAEALSKNKEMILLDWFGGEPLLHFDDIIYPITKELNAWGKENDVRIFSIITTNGSLINEDMVEKMREIELNQFQITLDGGRTFHNKTRYNSLMKDSYSVIINNIHLLYTLNPNAFVELRINYTPQNVISLSSILDDIAIELRPKILLSPHIVWQTAAKQEEMQTELDDFFSLAHEKGFYTKNDEVRSRCTSCYVDNADQYVINYDLTVYKCTARDFNKQFAIGEISQKGNFIPNALYYKYLLTEPSFVNKECLSCDVLPVCLNSNLCLQKKIEGVTLPCSKEKVKQSLSEMIASKIRDLNHKNPLLLILVLCFSLFFQTLRAQESTGSLRGKIIDSKQENVAAATLLLQRPQDSVYYKSTTTDTDGNYRITDIAAGEYELTVYSIGYSEQKRKVQIGNEELVVNFTLTEKLEAIDQVRISRQYSRYLPTGELFVQVRKNPLAIGQSTLDFLRHVRGVLVRDNEILILGRRGTEVYINDRPASFEELAAVPTTMVENIEVVEQAGAEYGVLGHGIIKVTLRDEGGLIGSVHGRVALRTEGYAQTSVDNSLQYHKGKFTIYNTISAKHNNSLTRSRQELASSKYLLRTQGDGTGYTLNDNLGLQLRIKTRHTLSVYGGVGLQNSDATLSSKNNATEVLRRENTLRSLDYNGGLFYHYKIPYGKLSYFSLRSTLSSEDESDSQLYTSNGNTQSKETYKMSHATTELKLRLVNESGHVFNFGAYGGYLPNQRRLEGNFGSSLPGLQNISTEDNSYSYRVWGEYRKSFTRFTLRVGLTHYARRYTLRDNVSDRDTVQRQWGLYPNLALRYTIDSEKQSMLGLSYNYAYSIPNYGYEDITPRYSSDNLYSIGNWNLTDEKIHQLQLIYYINSNWFVWYELENINQKIYVMTHPDPKQAGLYFTRPENVGQQFLHTLYGLCNNRFFSVWNVSYLVNLSYLTEHMPSKDASCFYGGVNFVNNVKIFDFYLNLDFRATSPITSLYGKEGYNYSFSGSISHSFLSNQLYVVLGVNNFLYGKTTYRNDYMTRVNYSPRELIYLRARWSFSVGKEFDQIDEEKVDMLRSNVPTLK